MCNSLTKLRANLDYQPFKQRGQKVSWRHRLQKWCRLYITDVTIVREEGLKAGETATFTETFTDDEPNGGWRRVGQGDLSSMRIIWKPWKITLGDGTHLVGTMEQPAPQRFSPIEPIKEHIGHEIEGY